MTKKQLNANTEYFKSVINQLNEGGMYVYPDAMQMYTKQANCLVGSKTAIDVIKSITNVSFHNQLIVK